MIAPEIFQHMKALPHHIQLCQELLQFFQNQSGITSAFLSGSGVTGGMDFYSDLDLGFVCESAEAKEEIWSQRFEWTLPPWFHRMDADHIKSYFIIYLFEPQVHVDLCFYTPADLPSPMGGPYAIAFDPTSQLKSWLQEANKFLLLQPNWSNVVHEEERVWTWIHYAWCHIGRGEYYNIAAEFAFLRDIPHSWFARLQGADRFNSRRLEQRGELQFIENMKLCYPMPNRPAMKTALLNLIAVHNAQRAQVDRLLAPQWNTTQKARDKITRLVEEL